MRSVAVLSDHGDRLRVEAAVAYLTREAAKQLIAVVSAWLARERSQDRSLVSAAGASTVSAATMARIVRTAEDLATEDLLDAEAVQQVLVGAPVPADAHAQVEVHARPEVALDRPPCTGLQDHSQHSICQPCPSAATAPA